MGGLAEADAGADLQANNPHRGALCRKLFDMDFRNSYSPLKRIHCMSYKSHHACLDCPKIVKKTATRCRKCRDEFLRKNPHLHPQFKTGKYKSSIGYIYIIAPYGYPKPGCSSRILEHRLVMEKYIGRYLKSGEIVHHKNGIRDDNRIENLLLCKSNRQHRQLHRSPPCRICGRPHASRGFCKHHWSKWKHIGFPVNGIRYNGKYFKPIKIYSNCVH